MKKKFIFIVQNKDSDKRLDSYLEKELIAQNSDVSRSFIQNHINSILVNGEPKKKNYKVKINDHIEFTYPEIEPLDLIPEDIDFETVYEDEYLMVINKPAGLVVHPSKGHYTGTLVHGLIHKLQNFNREENSDSNDPKNDIENNKYRPGIVHRLDKETSGLLVVAKNPGIQRKLMKAFQNREIDKRYLALVKGKVPLEGKIDEAIARHPVHRKKFRVDPSGKSALTYFNRLEYFDSDNKQGFSFVKVKIVTGRTHQIRVHLSSIGHAVIGDEIYSKIKSPVEKKGMALCASELSFVHPATQESMEFKIDLPEYFENLMEAGKTVLRKKMLR